MERSKNQTASAAVFSVGAELSRRGYDVAFTLGNTARFDMFGTLPDSKQFKVQVEGLSGAYGFYVQETFFTAKLQSDLFLVVVLMSRPQDASAPSFRFFVLSHAEAKREGGKMTIPNKRGLNWGSITPYENKWETFPKLPG